MNCTIITLNTNSSLNIYQAYICFSHCWKISDIFSDTVWIISSCLQQLVDKWLCLMRLFHYFRRGRDEPKMKYALLSWKTNKHINQYKYISFNSHSKRDEIEEKSSNCPKSIKGDCFLHVYFKIVTFLVNLGVLISTNAAATAFM